MRLDEVRTQTGDREIVFLASSCSLELGDGHTGGGGGGGGGE